MQIDPTDNEFEPTKRYLVVIPGTGYFHVDNFEELAADLLPEYPLTGQPQAEGEAYGAGDEANQQRQALLGELAARFIRVFTLQMNLAGPEVAATYPIELVSASAFQPYTQHALPRTTPQREVITATQLDEFEAQLRSGQLQFHQGKRYTLVIPLTAAPEFFRMLSLAGLVQISDLQPQQ